MPEKGKQSRSIAMGIDKKEPQVLDQRKGRGRKHLQMVAAIFYNQSKKFLECVSLLILLMLLEILKDRQFSRSQVEEMTHFRYIDFVDRVLKVSY